MSKKHYIKMAALFKEHLDQHRTIRDNPETSTAERIQAESARMAVERLALCFCNLAADDNPLFNRARFLEACGF